MSQPLTLLVQEVAGLLRQSGTRVVFAESCTAGLVSAALGRMSGISNFHCGSAVVYRLDTKTRWLGVSEQLLCDEGAVSAAVAQEMAIGVLERTPEADLSAAITGHLGPNAPPEQDGLVFVALARRSLPGAVATIALFERRLPQQIPETNSEGAETLREWRQWKGTELVLSLLRDELLHPT